KPSDGIDLCRRGVLRRPTGQRARVVRGVVPGLRGLRLADAAPLQNVAVRTGEERVPDVCPAPGRPGVEGSSVLPVLHTAAVRLGRQPQVRAVVVDDQPAGGVGVIGGGRPPAEVCPAAVLVRSPHVLVSSLPKKPRSPCRFSDYWQASQGIMTRW